MATHNNKHTTAPLHVVPSHSCLTLSPGMSIEQSAVLADGKLLTATVDTRAGLFTLARHLKNGSLDPGFGEHGVQHLRSDIACDVTYLALRVEADNQVVLRGSLRNQVDEHEGLYLLRILPTAAARPCLGIDAFLIVSRLPYANARLSAQEAPNDWTWLRWPAAQAQ